jgi:RNA polymerase sigma-B factor
MRGVPQTELFRQCQSERDRLAREALVERYLPLARKLARRYARSSEPLEDLVQVASVALLKAVDRFDPSLGNSFPAFATPTILGELRRYFRDCGWSVHVPRGTQERVYAIEQATERLTDLGGRPPTVNQIAEDLHFTIEEVLDGLQAAQAYQTGTLDQPARMADQDLGWTLGETIGAEDERYELIELDISLSSAVHRLPELQRRVLYLRFMREMSQTEIAVAVGVSQMQVSRILRSSIARLRQIADDTVED